MALLLLYLFLALGVSFLCSVLEAVLLSITPSYIALKQKEGGHVGERLDTLKSDIDRPLSALLSLNTIAHTIGAAGVGAQSQVVFGNGVDQPLPVFPQGVEREIPVQAQREEGGEGKHDQHQGREPPGRFPRCLLRRALFRHLAHLSPP